MAVAQDERHSIRAALEGAYGDEQQQRAKTLGLAHIVTSLYEVRGGWDVTDFLTGETYRRPFKWKKGERVERWDDQRGWVRCVVVEKTDSSSVRVRDDVSGVEAVIDFGHHRDIGGITWPSSVKVKGAGFDYIDTCSAWELKR